MLAFLSPYKLFIEIGVLIAIVLAVLVGIHKFLDYEQGIGYDKAVNEYTAAALKAEEAARLTEVNLRKQLEDATNAATQREQTIRAANAAAAASANGLRDALGHIRDGVPGATAASLAQSTIALATLFDQCATRYTDVAEKADRHASDAKRLIDSWPKVK